MNYKTNLYLWIDNLLESLLCISAVFHASYWKYMFCFLKQVIVNLKLLHLLSITITYQYWLGWMYMLFLGTLNFFSAEVRFIVTPSVYFGNYSLKRHDLNLIFQKITYISSAMYISFRKGPMYLCVSRPTTMSAVM